METLSTMCKRESCTRSPVYARGMCFHHYGLFMKKARRRGLEIGRPYIETQLPDVLPCTISKVSEQLETHLMATQKAMKKLHKAEKIHITGFEFTGARWAAIFSMGPGVDAVLDPEQLRMQYLERRRQRWSAQNKPAPEFAALCAALGL